MATPATYRSSWAKGPIGAAAQAYATATASATARLIRSHNTRFKPQCWILSQLSKAEVGTHILAGKNTKSGS